MSPSNAYAAYRSAEVETLTPRDLIVKLYQGMEGFLARAVHALRNEAPVEAATQSFKAKRILFELLSTLNMEVGGETAARLRDLYLFLIGEIVEANQGKDADRIAAVLPVIATLREAWQQVPEQFAKVSSLPESSRGSSSIDIRQ